MEHYPQMDELLKAMFAGLGSTPLTALAMALSLNRPAKGTQGRSGLPPRPSGAFQRRCRVSPTQARPRGPSVFPTHTP